MKLFQDAAGTIPATLAGQPVGLVKRVAGTVDATQATALSKPTLARWPMSGRRNLANGAQAVGVASYWPNTASGGGLTATKVGYGLEEDGTPYVDVRYAGTATTSSLSTTYAQAYSYIPNEIGSPLTCAVSAKIIAGSMPSSPAGVRGIAAVVNELTSGGAYVAGSSSAGRAASGEYTEISVTRVSSAPSAQIASGIVQLSFVAGDVIDVTFRIKGLQFERGAVQTPLQFNYGPNDITEAGVKDLWHLFNDGGDSLNCVLPAGTYGVANLPINKVPVVGTVVSDGTTPINTLLAERQLDVVIREGTFSSAESLAIQDYWKRTYG